MNPSVETLELALSYWPDVLLHTLHSLKDRGLLLSKNCMIAAPDGVDWRHRVLEFLRRAVARAEWSRTRL